MKGVAQCTLQTTPHTVQCTRVTRVEEKGGSRDNNIIYYDLLCIDMNNIEWIRFRDAGVVERDVRRSGERFLR